MDVNALFTKMQKALHELRRNAQKKKTFGIERESI